LSAWTWYWYYSEYPDEGVCGPFEDRASAEHHARRESGVEPRHFDEEISFCVLAEEPPDA
jgi:hypothetical protein